MDFNELRQKILEKNPKANMDLIKKAYEMAERAHGGQKRVSGEDYFMHPYSTAEIVISMGADTASICSALLHDIVEDTDITLDDIKKAFNDEIAQLVEGMTKLRKIQFESDEEYKAENIRKILLATTKDVRVILIKLADKLHNMRTLGAFNADKQKKIAKEVLQIYSPIAHKLGMTALRSELDDLAMKFLYPETYQEFKERIVQNKEKREQEVNDIIKKINDTLVDRGIKPKVYGRAKSFYSIYRKMLKKNKEFNEIFDINAVRIIVNTVPECYQALGSIHELWKPMPGKFKDYISVPKGNGYQSLHTVVIGPHGKILEVQIRTWEMHHIAEEGIAAHWRYQDTERDKKFDRKVDWLKQVLNWMRQSETASDFIEHLKIDFLKDEIVVFTPKGDPISLPENATPVDFAYEIHSDLGEITSKAKVNNKVVPLDHVLKSGDIVEIITQKNAKPSRQWLNSVKTTKARAKIKQSLGIVAEHKPKQARLKHEQKETEKVSLTDQLDVIEKEKSLVKFSKCCGPSYLDDIEAYKTKDGKITIHKKGCPNIAILKGKSKLLDIHWKKETHYIKMSVVVKNRVGLLAEVLNILSTERIDISSINSTTKKDRINLIFEWSADVFDGVEHLKRRVLEIRNVIDVMFEVKKQAKK